MKRPLIIGLTILLALAALVAGFMGAFNHFPSAALRAVTSDPKLVLYSLDPLLTQAPGDPASGFHGFPILGQTVLSEASDRELIAASLRRAALWASNPAICFNPRHGLRATDSSGTYDLAICFECGHAIVYFPDGHEEDIPIHGPPTTLNDLLAAAHLPLAR